MDSSLLVGVESGRQLRLHSFYLVALLLSISIANTHCSESVCYNGRPRLYSPHPGMQYSSNHLQGDARVQLALENRGTAAGEERHHTTPGRHLKVTSTTTDVKSYAIRANLTGTRAPETEVKTLATFKAAIFRDPLNALRSWNVRSATNGSDVCSSWAGVICSPRYPYHVVALILPGLQLAGNLNSMMREFAQLPFLQRLDLSNNFFTGSMNGRSLTNFSRLFYLNVSYNSLTGGIPSEMGELVSLQDLDVRANNLSGVIPSLANCSFLRLINLGSNLLDGNIPRWFGTLSSLEILRLHVNSLSGNIPSELGNCSSLRRLDVSTNYLVGTVLPQELSKPKLQKLQVSFCSFGGSIPMWIGNLTTLQILSLSYNRFEGEIPDTIGRLKLLTVLQLGGNLLTGAVPLSISNCTFLVELSMETNQVEGHIPQEVGLLASLELLSFAENNLTGVIPSSLENCSALFELDLGLNLGMDPQPFPSWIGFHTNLQIIFFSAMSLQGEFPELVGNLSNLRQLYLFGNNLYGTLPTSLKNCALLEILEIQRNNLTGSIPSELGLLSYLTDFHVDGNQFTGPFPAFFVNWTQLVVFDVIQNLLSGMLEVPATIGNLNQLIFFGAGNNDFGGPIPKTLGNSSSITELFLDGNRLSGAIPSSLLNMTSLQQLVLQDNRLEGKIPVDILKFGRQFGLLTLSQNLLKGSIPSEIGELSGLTYLDLSNNNFSGVIPSSLGNCSIMNILDLSHNRFEGNIPASAITAMFASLRSLNLSHNLFSGLWLSSEFSKLVSIQVINVSANYLSGSVPLGLGECISLQSLDISMNHFTGEIPQDLGLLSKLEFFNASFNAFEGPIPNMGLFNSNRITGDSFLGNPALCGLADIIGPNHQECAVAPRNDSSYARCGGFKCTKVWVPVTAAIIASILLLVKLRMTSLSSSIFLEPLETVQRNLIPVTMKTTSQHLIRNKSSVGLNFDLK